jgi:hypothetical protein
VQVAAGTTQLELSQNGLPKHYTHTASPYGQLNTRRGETFEANLQPAIEADALPLGITSHTTAQNRFEPAPPEKRKWTIRA